LGRSGGRGSRTDGKIPSASIEGGNVQSFQDSKKARCVGGGERGQKCRVKFRQRGSKRENIGARWRISAIGKGILSMDFKRNSSPGRLEGKEKVVEVETAKGVAKRRKEWRRIRRIESVHGGGEKKKCKGTLVGLVGVGGTDKERVLI